MESWKVVLPCLDSAEVDSLEVSSSKEEIRCGLMEIDGNATPGPDEFIFKFVQNFWSELLRPCSISFLKQQSLIIGSHLLLSLLFLRRIALPV